MSACGPGSWLCLALLLATLGLRAQVKGEGPLPYSFLRHPVSGRDPQKGDDDDRDDEGSGRSGPRWAHVAPAQA